ncbi:zinc finger protein 711-like [Colletes latitarsis]|uniref:zinc finger protein 711-like n=1 Tax=Colletes latitarsis TaxID=2605962 RepID=UPI0040354A50
MRTYRRKALLGENTFYYKSESPRKNTKNLPHCESFARSRFTCQKCGRGYTMLCNLRRHMKWECGGKRLDELAIRRSVHRKSRHANYLRDEDLALRCPQCGRRYKVQHSLNKHLKFECGGRRNFACNFCGNSYTQNVNLRRHLMRIHNVYCPPRKQCVRKIL